MFVYEYIMRVYNEEGVCAHEYIMCSLLLFLSVGFLLCVWHFDLVAGVCVCVCVCMFVCAHAGMCVYLRHALTCLMVSEIERHCEA